MTQENKTTTSEKNVSKRVVVIDTCVLQHAGSSETREVVTEYLQELSQHYNLVISHISVFENLRGLSAPLFETNKWKPLVYRSRGRYEKTLDLFLCEPNLELISRKTEEADRQNT